jgi:hypothetical protein
LCRIGPSTGRGQKLRANKSQRAPSEVGHDMQWSDRQRLREGQHIFTPLRVESSLLKNPIPPNNDKDKIFSYLLSLIH